MGRNGPEVIMFKMRHICSLWCLHVPTESWIQMSLAGVSRAALQQNDFSSISCAEQDWAQGQAYTCQLCVISELWSSRSVFMGSLPCPHFGSEWQLHIGAHGCMCGQRAVKHRRVEGIYSHRRWKGSLFSVMNTSKHVCFEDSWHIDQNFWNIVSVITIILIYLCAWRMI